MNNYRNSFQSIVSQLMAETNKAKTAFLALAFFVFLILLFVSTDSYLHGLYGKVDSSLFFMCGKAWMNGFLPYVDFSDSKGPLLWFIYGVGYLLSKTSYVGVFWLSWIFYSFTFFYVFKTICLFIKDHYLSFIATLGMGLFYFNICVHNIVRAEDFCQLFIAMSLYYTCSILYSDNVSPHQLYKSFFVLGFCASCTLLMKFTITAMLAVLLVYLCLYAYQMHRLRKAITWMLLGALTIILPFVVYFLITGTLGIFIEEYFLRTLLTVGNSERGTLSKSLQAFVYPNVLVYTLITFFSVLLFTIWSHKKRFFPLISYIWILVITCQNAWNYYYNSLSIFGIFGLIVIAAYCNKVVKKEKVLLIIPVLLLLIIVPPIKLVPSIRDSFLKSNRVQSEQFDKIANYIKSKHQPRILYLGTFSTGIGILAEALPACRYFFEQTGQTKDMTEDQLTAIKERTPDFVIVKRNEASYIKTLHEAGYIDKKICYHNTLLFYK